MTLIYVLLIAHFVADFICQTDWMALNKSKRWDALAVHVAVYIVVLMVIVGTFGRASLNAWLAFWATNAAAHFVQDAITSRINAKLWFLQREAGIFKEVEYCAPQRGIELINPWVERGGSRHWFFVAIGADQLLHYVTLFVTAGWWLQ